MRKVVYVFAALMWLVCMFGMVDDPPKKTGVTIAVLLLMNISAFTAGWAVAENKQEVDDG